MFSEAEIREIELADKSENRGPLTDEDYAYERIAQQEIRKMMRQSRPTCDAYTDEHMQGKRRKKRKPSAEI